MCTWLKSNIFWLKFIAICQFLMTEARIVPENRPQPLSPSLLLIHHSGSWYHCSSHVTLHILTRFHNITSYDFPNFRLSCYACCMQLANYVHTGGQTDEHRDGCAVLTLLTSVSRHQVTAPRQPYISRERMRHFQFESCSTAPHTVCCTGR